MNADTLKKLIRGIIKEELQECLPTMIPKVLSEILSGNSTGNVISETITRKNPNLGYPVTHKKPEPVVPKPLKRYTQNEVLNKILNETTPGLPQTAPYVGYDSELQAGSSGPGIIAEQIIPKNDEQAAVLSVITKDFRSVMKAIDKKKNGGMGMGAAVSFDPSDMKFD